MVLIINKYFNSFVIESSGFFFNNYPSWFGKYFAKCLNRNPDILIYSTKE